MIEAHVLNKEHTAVKYLCAKDKRFAKLVDMVGEIEYRIQPDCFTRLVFSIINQMLSNKAAHAIGGRFAVLCNGCVTPENLLKLNRDQLRGAGLSYTKADNILGIAKAATDGSLVFSDFSNMTDEEVINELTRLRGIGIWSAKMFLIFTSTSLFRRSVSSFQSQGIRDPLPAAAGTGAILPQVRYTGH